MMDKDNEASSDDWSSASSSSSSSSADDDSAPQQMNSTTKSRALEPVVSARDDASDSEDSDSDDSDDERALSEHGNASDDSDDAHLPQKEDLTLSLGERLMKREGRMDGNALLKNTRMRRSKARKVLADRISQLKKDRQKDVKGQDSSQASKISALSKKKKKSKHAPTEASSKKKDFYNNRRSLNESGIGVEINANRYKPRDPRLSSLSGHLDEEHFERNFSFLDEVRQQEIKQLKKRIAARKATGKKGNSQRRKLGITKSETTLEDDVAHLKQLQQVQAEMQRKQVDRNARRTVKRKLKEEVETGKRSANHYLKRRDMKRLVMEAKFDEIQKRGGDAAVEKALNKRRKKSKARDAKTSFY